MITNLMMRCHYQMNLNNVTLNILYFILINILYGCVQKFWIVEEKDHGRKFQFEEDQRARGC